MKVSTGETNPSSAAEAPLSAALAALLLSTAHGAERCAPPTISIARDRRESPSGSRALYAWTSPQGRKLNLIMTIQGHTFSDKVDYVFHVDSGKVFAVRALRRRSYAALPRRTRSTARSAMQTPHPGPTNPTGLEGAQITGFACTPLCVTTPFYNNLKGF